MSDKNHTNDTPKSLKKSNDRRTLSPVVPVNSYCYRGLTRDILSYEISHFSQILAIVLFVNGYFEKIQDVCIGFLENFYKMFLLTF